MPLSTTNIALSVAAIQRINTCTEQIASAASLRERTYWTARQAACLDGLLKKHFPAQDDMPPAITMIVHGSRPETLAGLAQTLTPLRDDLEIIIISRRGIDTPSDSCASLTTIFPHVRILTWTTETADSENEAKASGAALAAALRMARGLTLAVNPEPNVFVQLIAALEAHPEASIASASSDLAHEASHVDLARTAWRNWLHARCGYPAGTDSSGALSSLLSLAARETTTITGVSGIIRPESLALTPPAEPVPARRVSIIIPVFNHVEYTGQCLAALEANTTYPNYEVIIVNNGSSDETAAMLAARKNIAIIHNAENKGFTEACNQGAQAATGDYLLFLNNDTIPLKGWLEPLVRRITEVLWIGAVGSRLIYPNGTLQEAAAVVHRDGTASNFGRHDHPARPQFNRPCEVDYCSGASLLVRADLFRELGGFDMRYSPAYYEETDLCFALREMGKAVVYEPASAVIHFGSTTAGLDPSKGIRRHLITNREVFLRKWTHRLIAHEPPPTPGQCVVSNDRALLGRRIGLAPREEPTPQNSLHPKATAEEERNEETKHIRRLCIVSDFMPFFDTSSSNLRVFRLMELMRRLGWEIDYLHFVDTPRDANCAAAFGPGVRFHRVGADAASMQATIAVIRPTCLWLTNIWTIEWTTQALKLIHNLEHRRASTREVMRIIVDTMDFHAKKHQRRYAAERTMANLHTAETFLKLERALYPLADVVITVTDEEARDIQAAVPDSAPITVIPNIHEPAISIAPLEGRRHMAFLGNYAVQHNRDAAVWFVTQVLPKVRTAMPDVEFHLVGAEAHARCADLARMDGVRLVGFVPSVEEALARYRVFTCPLTYGAGMKGKVGSAAATGLPIVTTTIGAEGFPFVAGKNCLIADTPHDFATACLALLQDDSLWTKISQASPAVVAAACGTDAALRALKSVLPETNEDSSTTVFSKDAATDATSTVGACAQSANTPAAGVTSPQPDARLLAFYLPQFHRIPENDAWWGEGFTEWTNVRRTTPAFPGHDQPLLPGELGWYDLSDINVMRAQADLARRHDVHGFCFYHYWFHGRRILEAPVENFLASDIALPFCLCWANENWSRNWDGGDRELLLKQHHSPDDDEAHFRLLLRFMQDSRYIRVNDKPLLLVYRTRLLPDPKATASRWRIMAKRAGLPGLHLCKVEGMSTERDDPGDIGFDAAVEFQPDWTNLGDPRRDAAFGEHRVHDYDVFVARQLEKPAASYRRYPCVTPRWDNTPRRPKDSVVLLGSSPDRYRRWLSHAVESVAGLPDDERLVFINAWNEWGEGCALEPDLLRGNAYLEATAEAMDTGVRELDLQLERRLNEVHQMQANASMHHPESIRYAQGFVSGLEKSGRWMGREARLDIVPPPGGGRLLLRVASGHPSLYGDASPAVTLTIGETKLPFPLRDTPSSRERRTTPDVMTDGPSGQATFEIEPGQPPFIISLATDRQFIPVEAGLSQERSPRSVQVLARFEIDNSAETNSSPGTEAVSAQGEQSNMTATPHCKNPGWCPICEKETVFISAKPWLRDHYHCLRCGSIPRFRALIRTLDRFIPHWRRLTLHEFAPGGASSDYLRTQCKRYSASHYLPDVPFGSVSPRHGFVSQNMEALTYPEASFDVIVSQDVMEHLLDPIAAWREIARVLKPGGAYVFTVPWYPEEACTRRRAERVDGQIRHLAPPQYHGNPVDSHGSLVTVDWGIDMPEIIHRLTDMTTTVSLERDRYYGIDGEFLEVFISRKPITQRETA